MAQLVDFVAASIPLKRRGKAWWAPCPFHNEKTSSFKVEERAGKQRFHCFGCGARGDAADWIMRTRNVGFLDAKKILGETIKADPSLLEERRRVAWREHWLNEYRAAHPDCELSQPFNAWLLVIPPTPKAFRLRRSTPPIWTEDEIGRIADAMLATCT